MVQRLAEGREQRIAELEAQVEQHKAAEEMQIKLREKLDEELGRHKRMFAAACESLGEIQKALGNEIVGIEPQMAQELIEERDALAAFADDFCSAAYQASEVMDDFNKDQCEARARLDHFRYNAPEPVKKSLARRDALIKADSFAEAVTICQKIKEGQDSLAWMHKEVSPDGEEYIGDYGIPYSNKALGAQHCADEMYRQEAEHRRQAKGGA